MQKIKSKIAALGVIFFAVFAITGIFSKINTQDVSAASGTFGVNGGVTWTFNESTKKLTIEPTNGTSGNINKDGANGQTGNHYTSAAQWPWHSVRNQIREVEVKSGVSTWGNVNLSYMFADCPSLTKVDLSGLDGSKVRHVNNMFSGCKSLTDVSMPNLTLKTDSEPGNNLAEMFKDCSSLTSIDVSNLRTDNAASMKGMFYGCTSLTELDLSTFTNNNKIYEMQDMFRGCTNLATVILNNEGFKTRTSTGAASGSIQMQRMFMDCDNLKTVDMSNITIYG